MNVFDLSPARWPTVRVWPDDNLLQVEYLALPVLKSYLKGDCNLRYGLSPSMARLSKRFSYCFLIPRSNLKRPFCPIPVALLYSRGSVSDVLQKGRLISGIGCPPRKP